MITQESDTGVPVSGSSVPLSPKYVPSSTQSLGGCQPQAILGESESSGGGIVPPTCHSSLSFHSSTPAHALAPSPVVVHTFLSVSGSPGTGIGPSAHCQHGIQCYQWKQIARRAPFLWYHHPCPPNDHNPTGEWSIVKPTFGFALNVGVGVEGYRPYMRKTC